MFKFNFETLHKNHKLAFTDGFLSGIVCTYLAYAFYKDYQEMKEQDRRLAEAKTNNTTWIHRPN